MLAPSSHLSPAPLPLTVRFSFSLSLVAVGTSSKWNHIICPVSDLVPSVSCSQGPCMLYQVSELVSFSRLSNIPLYRSITFVSTSMHWWTPGSLSCSGYWEHCCREPGWVRISSSPCFHSSRSGAVGTCGDSRFNFLKCFHTVFHSGRATFASHRGCTLYFHLQIHWRKEVTQTPPFSAKDIRGQDSNQVPWQPQARVGEHVSLLDHVSQSWTGLWGQDLTLQPKLHGQVLPASGPWRDLVPGNRS